MLLNHDNLVLVLVPRGPRWRPPRPPIPIPVPQRGKRGERDEDKGQDQDGGGERAEHDGDDCAWRGRVVLSAVGARDGDESTGLGLGLRLRLLQDGHKGHGRLLVSGLVVFLSFGDDATGRNGAERSCGMCVAKGGGRPDGLGKGWGGWVDDGLEGGHMI